MQSIHNPDTWAEIIPWCPMVAWVALWLCGNCSVQHLLKNSPKLAGIGHYFPVLQQLPGLLDLDLQRDLSLPMEWLSDRLPPNIHTLQVSTTRSTVTLTAKLPATLTDLSISPSDRWFYMDLEALPHNLTSLSLNNCDALATRALTTFPHLLSFNLTGICHDDRLHNFLSLAPSLTSYSGIDCFHSARGTPVQPFVLPEYIRTLNTTFNYNISQPLASILSEFINAQITISCAKVEYQLPSMVTALTVQSITESQVKFLPDSLTSLTGSYSGGDTDELSKLPELRELIITDTSVPLYLTIGGFPKLKILKVGTPYGGLIPSSVTDLTLRTGGDASYTVDDSARYHRLAGIACVFLQMRRPHHIAPLVSLSLTSYTPEIHTVLKCLPSDNLRELVIDPTHQYASGFTYSNESMSELMAVCCSFNQLRRLYLSIVRSQKHEPAYCVGTHLALPSYLTDLTLRLSTSFATVTFPDVLTKLTLYDTLFPVEQLQLLSKVPLLSFVCISNLNSAQLLKILCCLPHRMTNLVVMQWVTSESEVLSSADPEVVAYLAARKRYLNDYLFGGKAKVVD